jgi:UDP:flavonoid glycosyltransferase YjiC (YdhE family)
VDGRGDGDIVVGGVTVSASRFRSAVLPASRDPRFVEHFMRRLEGIERAASVVVNSFEELEGASVKAAVCEVPMRLVGPLAGANEARKSGASFFREEERCVDWLDKFGAETVVYVAFGSVAGMGSEEVRELAAGVEASGRPFLWVARDGLPPVPEGFVHRTSARGLVVRWAPQSRVLAHPSVGAFLTHCGWNSTMDAVLAGVPMLCFPLFGDQHLNAMLVDGVWKLGASLLRYDGAPIRAADVEKSIARVLSPNDGVRERASRWKAIARRALEPAGSSRLAVDSIVADLLKGVMKTESVNALDASFT